ncbi:MAG: 30S ribosomal protein S8 [Candidatus Pacebacteria bacterium]|nr:30S ribosomal protein S8 [Candidatus Paceibacterota bacterium]
MVHDPVADFVNQIKNAGAVKKAVVSVPFSNLKAAIAEVLKVKGYVKQSEKKGKKVKKTLEVTLAYENDGSPKIKGVRRISKPGRRMYKSVGEITPVKYGHGTLVLSTPKGILAGEDARKEKVGGEALFEIW